MEDNAPVGAPAARRILVVDDEPTIADSVAARLRAEGFTVATAHDGPAAVTAADTFEPDLVVLDVMLPDINGKEVCNLVRSDKTMDDVRIICISGMVEQDKIQELRDAGADDFMKKPFDVDQLVARVCQLLDVEAAAAK